MKHNLIQRLGKKLKKVLVVHSDLMLGAGIENLLAREKDILVMGTSVTTNMSSDIDKFRPNVIVLDETLSFEDLGRVFDLLKDCPELRVMVINLQDNRVNIYNKREISISQSTDLVYAIKNNLDQVG